MVPTTLFETSSTTLSFTETVNQTLISVSTSVSTIINTITTSVPSPTTVSVPFTITEEADTVSVPFTITEEADTVSVPVTVTEEADTVSVPFTITEEAETITTTLPAETITVTEDGEVTTITIPPVTTVLTITQPGTTSTIIRTVTPCPIPTNPPSVSTTFNPKDDRTWGRRPGFICQAPRLVEGCNIFIDSPADEYICEGPCVPVPGYPLVEWGENQTSYYPPTDGYFNLDPNAFGLSDEIFEFPEVITKTKHGKTYTITLSGNYVSQESLSHYPPTDSPAETPTPTPYVEYKHKDKGKKHGYRHLLAKRDETIVPAVCFDDCNNCYLEAETVGKSPALCAADSVFNRALALCNECIDFWQDDTQPADRVYLDSKFAQYIGYCESTSGSPTNPDDGPVPEVGDEPPVSTNTQAPPNTNTAPQPIDPEPTTPDTPEPTPTSGDDDEPGTPATTPAASSTSDSDAVPGEGGSSSADDGGSGVTSAPTTSPTTSPESTSVSRVTAGAARPEAWIFTLVAPLLTLFFL